MSEVTETHFRFAQEKLGRGWLSPALTAQPRPLRAQLGPGLQDPIAAARAQPVSWAC